MTSILVPQINRLAEI